MNQKYRQCYFYPASANGLPVPASPRRSGPVGHSRRGRPAPHQSHLRVLLDKLRRYTSMGALLLTACPLTLLLAGAGLLLGSCTTMRQGEVGIKRKLGRLNQQVITSGSKAFNPFLTTIIKVPVTTQDLKIRSTLPSKEGLSIASDISILYRVKADQVPNILQTTCRDYEYILILPVFRSAAADVGGATSPRTCTQPSGP